MLIIVGRDLPLQNRTANAGRNLFYAGRGGQGLKQVAFRADDADLAVRNLDALGERAEMVATIAAAVDPDTLARRPGEPPDHFRRDGLLARCLQYRDGTRGVGLRLVADSLQTPSSPFSAGSSRSATPASMAS